MNAPRVRVSWLDEPGDDWEGSVGGFCLDNQDTPDVCEAVRALDVGESHTFGGGAAPLIRVTRTS